MCKKYNCITLCILLALLSVSFYTNGGLRENIVEEALSYVGVTETSPNCSPEISTWCKMHGIECNVPWCAIFFGAMYRLCGVPVKLNAWSPAWFPPNKIIPFEKAQAADAYGIYFLSLKRIAHIGMVVKIEKRDVYGVEGNSNNNGSREGNAVVRRIRDKDTVVFSSWIDKK